MTRFQTSFVLLAAAAALASLHAQAPKPKHINRAIELLEAGQPIYYTGSHSGTEGTFEAGKADAQTYADYISYDMEHAPYDVEGPRRVHERPRRRRSDEERPSHAGRHRQRAGQRHRRSGRSGQRVDVQPGARDGRARHHAHARGHTRRRACLCRDVAPPDSQAGRRPRACSTKAAAARTARRPPRRSGACRPQEYEDKADAWPLNPNGELLLGLKLEDKYALANAEQNLKVPGIGFAEWGPGDMALSLGVRGPGNVAETDPKMLAARAKVFAACKANKIFFLNSMNQNNVIDMIKEGVMVGPASQRAAEIGRQFTKRTMPW